MQSEGFLYILNTMMLGSKDLLPPTNAHENFRFELLRSKLLPQFFVLHFGIGKANNSKLPSNFIAIHKFPRNMDMPCYIQ